MTKKIAQPIIKIILLEIKKRFFIFLFKLFFFFWLTYVSFEKNFLLGSFWFKYWYLIRHGSKQDSSSACWFSVRFKKLIKQWIRRINENWAHFWLLFSATSSRLMVWWSWRRRTARNKQISHRSRHIRISYQPSLFKNYLFIYF